MRMRYIGRSNGNEDLSGEAISSREGRPINGTVSAIGRRASAGRTTSRGPCKVEAQASGVNLKNALLQTHLSFG